MKILLDEGLPRRAVALLIERRFDALHVTETGLTATADEEILAWARAQGRIVVTLDADFHTILATTGRGHHQSSAYESRVCLPWRCLRMIKQALSTLALIGFTPERSIEQRKLESQFDQHLDPAHLREWMEWAKRRIQS